MAIWDLLPSKEQFGDFRFLVFMIWQLILINLVILRPLSKFLKKWRYTVVLIVCLAYFFNFHT